jgi:parallel beta-helix repeat protein
MKKFRLFYALLCGFLLLSPQAFAKNIEVPSENFERKLNEAIEDADFGDVIILPQGHFHMQSEVVITKSGLTLRGQGMRQTTLSFKNQKVGAQGIYGSGDQLVFEDFAIEDAWGNGLKVLQANHVTFRRLRIAWTGGPKEENGAYGLYPVMSRNVLVEGCEVSGASDAGVYVGQSENIIVRDTTAFENVAGIEIENSKYADVYNNHAYNNTAGILIFNLPNLPVKGGKQTRVFSNKIENNNLKNFATPGSIVHLVPDGLGVFIMANSEVEIFKNEIVGNKFIGISVVNFAVTERKIKDPAYDPMPRHISIYDNVLSERVFKLPKLDQLNIIIKLILGFKTPEIVYDGINDGSFSGQKLSEYDKICIYNNKLLDGKEATYGNLHLDNKRKWYPYPGGPGSFDLAPHNCRHSAFPEVKFTPPQEIKLAYKKAKLKDIAYHCGRKPAGVNWQALAYDCPKLSDYNLFQQNGRGQFNPNESGFEYKLNNELFTDYAFKNRFIFLPPGTSMSYKDAGVFDFPLGTVISKTFSYVLENSILEGATSIETRLLVKRKDGWHAVEYVWDPENNEAMLMLGGDVKTLRAVIPNHGLMKIDYGIPNRRQCAACHETNSAAKGQLSPIGPKAKLLNWSPEGNSGKNQLDEWSLKKYLANVPQDKKQIPSLPIWDKPETGTLDLRAKSYLEINCTHCHSPEGPAYSTGLFLSSDNPSDSTHYGRCKPPVAAGFASGGHDFDVLPGQANKSILAHRMNHNHLAVRMPQLGRSMIHQEAVAVINEWINKMPGNCK